MFAGWEVPNALAALRSNRAGKALASSAGASPSCPRPMHCEHHLIRMMRRF